MTEGGRDGSSTPAFPAAERDGRDASVGVRGRLRSELAGVTRRRVSAARAHDPDPRVLLLAGQAKLRRPVLVEHESPPRRIRVAPRT